MTEQHRLNSLKIRWLERLSTSSTSSFLISPTFISSTLSPISIVDPIWVCNAILDFLSDQESSLKVEVSIQSLEQLIGLGLSLTIIEHGQGQRNGGWDHLTQESQKAELLGIRYQLIRYQRLLFVWQKLYSGEMEGSRIETPRDGHDLELSFDQVQDEDVGNDGQEEQDPWDEVENDYPSLRSDSVPNEQNKANQGSSTQQPLITTSNSTKSPPTPTPFPYHQVQSFLNSTALQSFLSVTMSGSDSPFKAIDELRLFLSSLHPTLKVDLFENRFNLVDLILRTLCLDIVGNEEMETPSQAQLLQRLIDERLLPVFNEGESKETSLWDHELDLEKEPEMEMMSQSDIVDDEDLLKKLIELDLIEAREEKAPGATDTTQPLEILSGFYRNEIDELQNDYGIDSLALCLGLSRLTSTYSITSASAPHSRGIEIKRLERQLTVLDLLKDSDLDLRALREKVTGKEGRIEMLRTYLAGKEGIFLVFGASEERRVAIKKTCHLIDLLAELGNESQILDQQSQEEKFNRIDLSTSYSSMIDFSSSSSSNAVSNSTDLFLSLILDLILRPTRHDTPGTTSASRSLTPASILAIPTHLLSCNGVEQTFQIPPPHLLRFILSIMLGLRSPSSSDEHAAAEILHDFDLLNQLLMRNLQIEGLQDESSSSNQLETRVTSRLLAFLETNARKSPLNAPDSLIISLLKDPTSPLSIFHLNQQDITLRVFHSISRRVAVLLRSITSLLKWQNINSELEVLKPLNECLLISLDLKEQTRFARSLCRGLLTKDAKVLKGRNKNEVWLELLDDLLDLINDHQDLNRVGVRNGDEEAESLGLLGLMNKRDIVKIWLEGVLSTGDFESTKQIRQQLPRRLPAGSMINDLELESLVLRVSREFYDSSESLNLHRGGMKMAYDCLSIIPSSSIIKKEKAFIEATSKLSTFQLPSSLSNSQNPPTFTPNKATSREIRSTADRLIFISLLLSSRLESYKSSEMVLDLGLKLSSTPTSKLANEIDTKEDTQTEEILVSKPLIEIRCLAMLIDSAIANEDLLEGYNLSQRLVEKISETRKRAQTMMKSQDKENVHGVTCRAGHTSKKKNEPNSSSAIDLLPVVEEIGWKSCFQLVKHPAWGEEEEEKEEAGEESHEQEAEAQGSQENESKQNAETTSSRSKVSTSRKSKDPDCSKRLKLMSQVLSLCPKKQLGPFLERWRVLDKEHFETSLREDLTKSQVGSSSYASRLNSKFLADSLGKASDLSFISPFSSLFNSSGLSSQLNSLGGVVGGGSNSTGTMATKPKANAPTGGFGKAAQLFDGFGDPAAPNSAGTSGTTSPWDYANVAIDPAERAARAARNFFGGFGSSPVLGSSPMNNEEKGREGSNNGNGTSRNVSASGFSFTRGMGWLMGEEER